MYKLWSVIITIIFFHYYSHRQEAIQISVSEESLT